MGDTNDGSSSAAQRAQLTPQQGILKRLRARFIPKKTAPLIQKISLTAPPKASMPMPGLLNLRRLRVADVLIPKADIVSLPISTQKDELIELFRSSGMTRIPVYNGTLDTPLGFIHLKDFVVHHSFSSERLDFDLTALLRPLLFVPPSMPLAILLQKMQTERVHMALVIDEYGGTDGLITIEDLLEQVVGAIEDEHDTEEEKSWLLESPGCYYALAKTPLDEFEAEIGMKLTGMDDISDEEIDTLGGLVSVLAGSVPVRGELLRHPSGLEFEVTDADPRRVKRLKIRILSQVDAAP